MEELKKLEAEVAKKREELIKDLLRRRKEIDQTLADLGYNRKTKRRRKAAVPPKGKKKTS